MLKIALGRPTRDRNNVRLLALPGPSAGRGFEAGSLLGELGQKGGVAVAVLVGKLCLRRDDLYDVEDVEVPQPAPVQGSTENEPLEAPFWPSWPPLDQWPTSPTW